MGPAPAARGPVPHLRRDRREYPRGPLHSGPPDGEEPLRRRGGRHRVAEDLHRPDPEYRVGLRRISRDADRLMARPIRVLLVDDHPFLRSSLRGILAECEELAVVGEAGNGEAALALIDRRKPEVVIMDLQMPGIS